MTSLAIEHTRLLATMAMDRLGQTPGADRAAEAVGHVVRRLDEPLRVALVGRVKAGKSTLLNAVVGERLAPTDAGECTRFVAWYRFGAHYRVDAVLKDHSRTELRWTNDGGKLVWDLPDQLAGITNHIEVQWPANGLRQVTMIDTPGLASLNDENSARTRDFLAFDDDRTVDADMVLYLMRHMHHRDAEYLDALTDRSNATMSPASAVAVLSRADEIGGGHPKAMESAHRIADRYAADPRVKSVCAHVVPLVALLAETGFTITEGEVADIRTLATMDRQAVAELLLSADRFCAPSALTAVDSATRRHLLGRLGLYGLRLAVGLVGRGRAPSADALSRHLVTASGLRDLGGLLKNEFLPRSDVLKARAALLELRRIGRSLASLDQPFSAWLDGEAERLESSREEFVELRLLQLVSQHRERFDDDELDQLLALASGSDRARRVRLDHDADDSTIRLEALALVDRWRSRGASALSVGPVREACDLAVALGERMATSA